MNNRSKTFESTYFNESFLVKSKTAQKKPESKQIKIENDKVNLKYFFIYLVLFSLKTPMKVKQPKYIKIKAYANNLDKHLISTKIIY